MSRTSRLHPYFRIKWGKRTEKTAATIRSQAITCTHLHIHINGTYSCLTVGVYLWVWQCQRRRWFYIRKHSHTHKYIHIYTCCTMRLHICIQRSCKPLKGSVLLIHQQWCYMQKAVSSGSALCASADACNIRHKCPFMRQHTHTSNVLATVRQRNFDGKNCRSLWKINGDPKHQVKFSGSSFRLFKVLILHSN